jgi:formylglycine-generating enzyme required for sulfatase activity
MKNSQTTACNGLVKRRSYFAAVIFCIAGLAQAGDVIENRFGMHFVKIPAGTFTMGTTEVESARMEFPELKPDDVLDETPAHPVTITRDFYLGTTEVTQGVWFRVMENKPGPEAFWDREDWQQRPMATSSWYMAARFVEELNKLDSDYRYRAG